ncbi:MAG: monovalent cation/H+ antiporter subunit D family protein [Calditerrivibrio sp.]|nr:monovalent cation/H+ antiporter subunit D family protein [Calditerrivibrio sp.]
MDINLNLPALVVVVPLLSSMLVVLVGMLNRKVVSFLYQIVSVLTFLFSLKLLIRVYEEGPIRYFFGNWTAPIGIEYYVDYLNAFCVFVVAIVFVVTSIYFPKSVQKEIPEEKEHIFYAVTMLFVTGLLGITITGDLFNIYVFTEIASITAYALIAIAGKKESYKAGFNYLILGTIGASFFVLGVGYLYMATGTLNLLDMKVRLIPMYNSKIVLVGAAFIIVGLSMKMALFPLHSWLPGAYTYSPSTISAIMSATSTKVMAYVLVRFLYSVFTTRFDVEVLPIQDTLFYISLVAIVVGSFLAIGQENIKMMLAYSSVGQIGYIVMGATMHSGTGIIGSIFHFFSHAIVKGGSFLVVGLIFYALNTTRISDLRGLYKRMPLTSYAFLIFALGMIGVPATTGFVSKWYLIVAAFESNKIVAVAVVLVSSLLTAIYFWRVVDIIFFKKAIVDDKIKEPLSMVIPTYILGAITIVLGVYPYPVVEYLTKASNLLMELVK